MIDARQAHSGRRISVGIVIVIALALIIAPLLVDLGNYILTLLVSLLIFITLSESWNLMGGYAGQVNLGLAAYFGTGALCHTLIYRAGAPLFVALVVGGLAATVVACIIGPPTLRLRGAYFGVGTMAVAEVLRLVSTTTFTQTIYSPASYWVTFTLTKSYYIALVVSIATILVAYILNVRLFSIWFPKLPPRYGAAQAFCPNPGCLMVSTAGCHNRRFHTPPDMGGSNLKTGISVGGNLKSSSKNERTSRT